METWAPTVGAWTEPLYSMVENCQGRWEGWASSRQPGRTSRKEVQEERNGRRKE